MESCSVSKSLEEEANCNKTAITNGRDDLSSLAELETDKKLLKLRSGCLWSIAIGFCKVP